MNALKGANEEIREFAAQTLSFLATHAPRDSLLALLESDANPTVRLYAADGLGAAGHGAALAERLEALRTLESDRDVKKHIGYTLSRGATGVDPRVLADLAGFEPSRIDSARVGEPAPKIDLESYSGGRVRLSDLRRVAPVVLVFLYGDTRPVCHGQLVQLRQAIAENPAFADIRVFAIDPHERVAARFLLGVGTGE